MTEQKNLRKSIPYNNYDKIPPQAIEVEQAVLGILIYEPYSVSQIMFLKVQMFYKEAHQKIFNAIMQLKEKNILPELIAVTNQLRTNLELENVGGAYYVTQLTNESISSVNLQYYGRIIYQRYLAREVIRMSEEHSIKAYEQDTDILVLIDKIKENFESLQQFKHESKIKKASEVTQTVQKNLFSNNLILETGWTQFDKMVSIEANKLILIGGAAKDGKSRWIAEMMKRILRKYGDKIFILWGTFEDKATDVFYNMASGEIHIKPKLIRNNQILGKEEEFNKFREEFETFPIHFIEEAVTSNYLKQTFLNLCNEYKDRMPILIVDNILTLADRDTYTKDLNAMYDYVMDQFAQARNLSNGIVIVVHHYKDVQMDKTRLSSGFRPELPDLKGTESFRRLPNHVLLINNPHKRKELFKEYSGKDRELLKLLFLIDVGANRDDSSDDNEALIRMLHDLNYSIFEEL